MIKLKHLRSRLEDLEIFEQPKVQLEQYPTNAEMASQMLSLAETSFGDIRGKAVGDLGVGCGILSIAAAIVGSAYNVGWDVDPDAIAICRRNLEAQGLTMDLIHADVAELALALGVPGAAAMFETEGDGKPRSAGRGRHAANGRGSGGGKALEAKLRRKQELAEARLRKQQKYGRGRQQQVGSDDDESGSGDDEGDEGDEGNEGDEGEEGDEGDEDDESDDEGDEQEEDGLRRIVQELERLELGNIPLSAPGAASVSPGLGGILPAAGLLDTVICNPPFGTRRAGIDLLFVRVGLRLCRGAVYSLHKTSTREHILKQAVVWGVQAQVLAELRWQLPKTMKHHKDDFRDIEVDLLRFAHPVAASDDDDGEDSD